MVEVGKRVDELTVKYQSARTIGERDSIAKRRMELLIEISHMQDSIHGMREYLEVVGCLGKNNTYDDVIDEIARINKMRNQWGYD